MVNELAFHEVSEQEKEQIKKQAKTIMDSFASKLEKIKLPEKEPFIERNECERNEGGVAEKIDRKIMFENAPNKNDDFIIAEKKSWGDE